MTVIFAMTRLLPLACILFLTLGSQQQNVVANPIMTAKDVIEFAFTLSEIKDKIKKILDGPASPDEELTKADVKMISQLQSISDEVEIFKTELFQKISKELQTKLSAKVEQLSNIVDEVNRAYKTFSLYVKRLTRLEKSTLEDFTKQMTSHSLVEMPDKLLNMHTVLTRKDRLTLESILSILANNMNVEAMCVQNLTIQQIINDLYELVISTHMKGLAIMLFSYDLKAVAESKTYKEEKDIKLIQFTDAVENTFAKVKVALATASRELWKCDPEIHNKGTTYSNLQEIFQKYINFEGDFFLDGHGCKGDCLSHRVSSLECNSPFCNNTSIEKRCNKGTLRDCETINNSMTLCKAPANSTRRYEWLETASGTKYGHYQHCDNSRTQSLNKEDAPWLYKCEYCVCTCDSTKNNINRHISLKKAVSDTYRNYVVTGARFRVLNNVFYIQIQQAVLGQNGSLIGTTRWKKIIEAKTGKLAKEVYYIDWNHRTVHLDDIEPEPKKEDLLKDRVVVGLQFQQDSNGLHLTVRTMAFNYTTGELDPSTARWESKMNSQNSRTPLSLEGSDDPVLRHNHLPNSHSGQYVHFQTTDLVRDLGQNTIPFIDMQDVTSYKPLPLAGVGIFHKGAKGSGGFLALKVIHYDYTKHL